MSNYTKTTNFTAKDSLPTGDSDKLVLGSEIDTELSAISTAIATKLDSSSYTSTTYEPVEIISLSGGGTSTGIATFSHTPASSYRYVIALSAVSQDTASTFQGIEFSASSTWRTTNEYSWVTGALTTTASSAASQPYIPILNYSGYTGESAATLTSGEILIYNPADATKSTAIEYRITYYDGTSVGYFYGSGMVKAAEAQDGIRLRLYSDLAGTTDSRDYDGGNLYLYRIADPT